MSKRNPNLEIVVLEFRKRNLTILDVAELLDRSMSNAKVYMRDLVKAKLVEVVGRIKWQGEMATYWVDEFGLTAPPVAVDAYLQSLRVEGEQPVPYKAQPRKPSKKRARKPRIDLTRTSTFIVPRRDPLVAAFFGEARC